MRDGKGDVVGDSRSADTTLGSTTTAMTRPTGLASGAENSPHTPRTICDVLTGAIR